MLRVDISLSLTKTSGLLTLTESTKYDISLAGISDPNAKLSVMDASGINQTPIPNSDVGSGLSSDTSYSLYIEDSNKLMIKCSEDASFKTSNGFFVSSLKFNLYDICNSNILLGPSDVYLHLAPACGLDISYNHNS